MIKLELTEQQIAIIGQALQEIPYKFAHPVLTDIQKQIDANKSTGSTEDNPA